MFYACTLKLANKTYKEAACSRCHLQVETNLGIAASDATFAAGGAMTSAGTYWMGLRQTNYNVGGSTW
jgi:hypothetical protein